MLFNSQKICDFLTNVLCIICRDSEQNNSDVETVVSDWIQDKIRHENNKTKSVYVQTENSFAYSESDSQTNTEENSNVLNRNEESKEDNILQNESWENISNDFSEKCNNVPEVSTNAADVCHLSDDGAGCVSFHFPF